MFVVKLRGLKALAVLVGATIVVACYGANPNLPIGDDGAAFSVQGLTEGVSGKVVSANSHHPVAGAAVTPESLEDPRLAIPELGVDTDQDGRYEWPLRPGRYAVTVLATGYQPITQEVRFGKGQVVTLDFILQDQ